MKTTIFSILIILFFTSISLAQQNAHIIINSERIGHELAKIEHYISDEVLSVLTEEIDIYLSEEFYSDMEELKIALLEQIEEADFNIYFDDEFSIDMDNFHYKRDRGHIRNNFYERDKIKEELLDALETLDEKDEDSKTFLNKNLDSWNRLKKNHFDYDHFPVK